MPHHISYEELGEYISDQDPYSPPSDQTFPDGFDDPSGSVTLIAGDAAHPLNLYWDFRHQRPWKGEPDRPNKPLKVENYRITKALVIPYTYIRPFDLAVGGRVKAASGAVTELEPGDRVEIDMVAHLLIGYVAVASDRRQPPETSQPTSGEPYERLGRFIRRETPFTRHPRLISDPDHPDETGPELAVTWLADFSAAAGQIASSSDNEMGLSQEQQCLYWDFPKPHLPGTVPPPTSPTWMRNYQITKAIRVSYAFDEPGQGSGQSRQITGEILIGYAGAGDH